MISVDELARGRTLAEQQGFTADLGRAAAALAAEAAAADRLGAARAILEGLAVTNPRDPIAWALLSSVYRRQGHHEAARVCAEAASRLAPGDPEVRLARAESLLLFGEERPRGRAELAALAGEAGRVGERARALLGAMGEGDPPRP